VRLITRAGNDFSWRFPLIVMAVAKLRVQSCLVHGEAIVCDESRLAVFELIRRQRTSGAAVHCAPDLIELDGEDLRRKSIETRKATLEGDGTIIYRHACNIVSKRLGSLHRSRRSAYWLKVKNPNAPAVAREAKEDGASRKHARLTIAYPGLQCSVKPLWGSGSGSSAIGFRT
jgi:bifunctional non-homologous end joining protein LigD